MSECDHPHLGNQLLRSAPVLKTRVRCSCGPRLDNYTSLEMLLFQRKPDGQMLWPETHQKTIIIYDVLFLKYYYYYSFIQLINFHEFNLMNVLRPSCCSWSNNPGAGIKVGSVRSCKHWLYWNYTFLYDATLIEFYCMFWQYCASTLVRF